VKIWAFIFATFMFLSVGCGGAPEPLDRDGIQRNADDAHRDLDRNKGQ
jgi:hypothetical protein